MPQSTASIYLHAPFPNVNVAGRYTLDVEIRLKNENVCTNSYVDMTLEKNVKNQSSVKIRSIAYIAGDAEDKFGRSPLQIKEGTLVSTERQVQFNNRKQKKAARTIDEGDDTVIYVSTDRELPEFVTIAGGDQLKADLTYLCIRNDVNRRCDHPLYINVKGTQGKEDARPLFFETAPKALEWLDWVAQDPSIRLAYSSTQGTGWEVFACTDENLGPVDPSIDFAKSIGIFSYSLNYGKPENIPADCAETIPHINKCR